MGDDLRGAELHSANLSRAVLDSAVLRGAHLSGASLFQANLSGANLRDIHNLTQAQLDQTCGTDAKLPPGLTLKPCPEGGPSDSP